MIVDPVDPSQAIAPSGRMAAKVFFLPSAAEPATLTASDLEQAIQTDGVQLGWADPADLIGGGARER